MYVLTLSSSQFKRRALIPIFLQEILQPEMAMSRHFRAISKFRVMEYTIHE